MLEPSQDKAPAFVIFRSFVSFSYVNISELEDLEKHAIAFVIAVLAVIVGLAVFLPIGARSRNSEFERAKSELNVFELFLKARFEFRECLDK